MSAATPRPWHADPETPDQINGPHTGTVAVYSVKSENRALIVLAVNAHDDLVAACEDAIEEIILLAGPNDRAAEGRPPTETDSALEKIRAALAKAKGGGS